MAPSTLTDATAKLYKALENFSDDERLKIVRAVLVLFGQTMPGAAGGPTGRREVSSGTDSNDERVDGWPAKAARWLQQFAISEEMLELCFHLEPSPPEVVGTIPGKSAREKTASCYLLTGVAALLKTGEANFDDAPARALCESTGCYDMNNHAKYVKLGNRMSGDKKKGWKLLAPGLKDAADLVKVMAGDSGSH